MIEKIPVSVYVLTTDNRRTIERCLKSFSWAKELVVVDSFSQDGTYEICKQYTDKFYQRKWTGHRDQYQYAADLTTQGWIMFVDADEEIPPELAEEIRIELDGRGKEFDGYFVYRRTYYLGRWIRYGGWYPNGENRLYRRDKGKWEGGLHAKLMVDGEIGVLKNQYLHYNYGNIKKKGIKTLIHYRVPIHLQKAYEDLGYRKGDFPLTEQCSSEILSLPLFLEMKEHEVEEVAGSIRSFVESQ